MEQFYNDQTEKLKIKFRKGEKWKIKNKINRNVGEEPKNYLDEYIVIRELKK